VPNAADSKVLLGRWNYSCWLLNTRLPDAGDSLALVEDLQAQLRDTRVVLLASLGTDRVAVPEPKRSRIVDWLVKNDSRERILDVVEDAIGPALPQAAV
jgi:FixJ family two-component response regulator